MYIAISQRDVSSHYPHLHNVKDQLSTELMNFFTSKLSKKFTVKNCEYTHTNNASNVCMYLCVDTFDVYRSGQVIPRRHC